MRFTLLRSRRDRRSGKGQGMVEFILLVPVFMILLLGMLEFGFAFTHNLTLEYATREGARVGSALVNGGGKLGCGVGQSPNAANVDPLIIAAVERVLTSPGSAISLAQIPTIRIFKANTNGTEAGPVNVWTQTLGAGPVPPGGTQPLNFSPPASPGWTVCSRTNSTAGVGPDSIGVSLVYSYQFTTGLKAISQIAVGSGPGPTILMSDRTVMALNPTNQ
jgi:hypothetical protein